MSLRLLADENVDRSIVSALTSEGLDVEHVDDHPVLSKGVTDGEIADYALDSNRVLLTGDDDFLREFAVDERPPVLFMTSEGLGPRTVAEIVLAITRSVERERFEDVLYVTRDWL